MVEEAVGSVTKHYFRNFRLKDRLSALARQNYFVELDNFAHSMVVNVAETMIDSEESIDSLAKTVEKDMNRLGNYTQYQEQKYQEILALEELSGYKTTYI